MSFLRIEGLLSGDTLAEAEAILAKGKFLPSAATPVTPGRNNLHLDRASAPDIAKLDGILVNALASHPAVRAFAQPNRVAPPRYVRYEEGMSYGPHTDPALMGESGSVRADVTLNLFLSDPSSYEGGELVVQVPGNPAAFKLPKGDAVLYPTSLVHAVRPVSKGVRIVAATWIQSLVRSPERRAILRDLTVLHGRLLSKAETKGEADLAHQAHGNLIRMWAEF